ncbi:MAG TPA: four helix bundle protein [Bacteroidales bacterium]|jgi:four helix bundle protein|nr:four helix bundle protein [Bacteroidales bacterium]|tara:strand:- start:58 stop:576 length:519 start_codon:yes stop_codon:yes gene_type:complete
MSDQIEKIEKAGTFFRFEDLRIYHKSLEYINWLQDVTMLFPDNNLQFVHRFNDSARNIAFFIAEGSARNKNQFIYYLKMAKSSIRECLIFTTLSYKQNNISETHENDSRNELMEMTKMIGALISSLQRSIGASNNGNHNNNYRYNGKGNEANERRTKYENVDDPNYNKETDN